MFNQYLEDIADNERCSLAELEMRESDLEFFGNGVEVGLLNLIIKLHKRIKVLEARSDKKE